MSNWFENHPVKSVIAHTIFVGGSVFAFSKFVLIENTENYYKALVAAKEATISQYEARIGFLENENGKMENEVNKYLEWLQNTPGSMQYVEKQNDELKKELKEVKENNNISSSKKYFGEYNAVKGDQAVIDEKTEVVFSVNNIGASNEGDLSFTYPGNDVEITDNITAGFAKEFSVNGKDYRIIIVSIDYISNRYSAIVKEI